MFVLGLCIGVLISMFFAIWYGGVLSKKQQEEDKRMFEHISEIAQAQTIEKNLKRYEG